MSDIFDFPRFSRAIGVPLLEMEDLKGPSIERGPFGSDNEANGLDDSAWETLGCWSLMQTSQNNTEEAWFFEAGQLSTFSCQSRVVASYRFDFLELEFTPMPSNVLMTKYPAPYGLAALKSLGQIMNYQPGTMSSYGDDLQVNETEVEQQREWHPGWDLPSIAPEHRVACIDAYLY